MDRSVIDLLVAVASLLVIAVPVGIMGAWSETRGIDAIGRFVCSWRPEGWPVGVQEEDDERRWAERTGAQRPQLPGDTDSPFGPGDGDIIELAAAGRRPGSSSRDLLRVRGITRRPNLNSN